jgi:catechol 2,3-dioxygenase-like lactoylglutathione lyase family enzyme
MSAPVEIKSLNHVAREAKDLEKSRAFYRDVLGFREVSRPNFSFPGAWLFNYGMMIHLVENQELPTGSEQVNTRDAHVAFHVDDIDGAEARLKAHGISYKKSVVPDRNIQQLFFHDPSGYMVEVGCYPPTPPYV